MIRDFSVTPKPQNSKSKILMVSFFVIAIAFLVASLFMDSYRGVVAMGALFSVTLGVLVYTKYVSVVFHYDILAEDMDEPLFVVRQTVGKRNVTLARIAFKDIVKIEKETLSERRAHKTERTVMKYVFTPTLAPDVSYRIYLNSRIEKAELIIEGSDEFAEMLRGIAAEARLTYGEEEE